MKKEQGITMISLIMYVIMLTFVVAGLTSITTSFFGSVSDLDKNSKSAVSYAKFNMIFLNDIKGKGAVLTSVSNAGNPQLEMNVNGTTIRYVVKNKSLYRQTGAENVKVCGHIQDAKITSNASNETVEVYLKIDNYERTSTYKIEPKFETT